MDIEKITVSFFSNCTSDIQMVVPEYMANEYLDLLEATYKKDFRCPLSHGDLIEND